MSGQEHILASYTVAFTPEGTDEAIGYTTVVVQFFNDDAFSRYEDESVWHEYTQREANNGCYPNAADVAIILPHMPELIRRFGFTDITGEPMPWEALPPATDEFFYPQSHIPLISNSRRPPPIVTVPTSFRTPSGYLPSILRPLRRLSSGARTNRQPFAFLCELS